MCTGVAFDEARFRQVQPQLAAYARGYVPTLLRRTGMDVRSVLEFGYAYNVDGALALVAPRTRCALLVVSLL